MEIYVGTRRDASSLPALMALLFLCGTAAAQAKAVATARAVAANDTVATTVRKALESGDAFKRSFLILRTGETKEETAAIEKDARRMLKEMRAAFPEKLKVNFVDGVAFNMGDTELPIVAITYRMKGESKAHPSRFRLVTSQDRQVYLVYSSNDKTGAKRLIHLLVWQFKGKWKAVDFFVVPTMLCGLSTEQAFAEAQKAEKTRYTFRAATYYAIAYRLTATAPCRMSGVRRRLQRALSLLAHKAGTAKKPLDTIEVSGHKMTIEKLAVFDLDEGPYLELYGRVDRIESPEKMQVRQRATAAACVRKYPSLKRYFTGIIIAAVSTDPAQKGKGYRSPHKMADIEKTP